jgi:hypothetical protein
MKVLVMIFSLLFIPVKIQAEPSPTVRQLMQDSFTMFDWGLYQLENFLAKYEFSDLGFVRSNVDKHGLFSEKDPQASTVSSQVDYEWDSNRVIITFLVGTTYSRLKKSSAKELCTNMTNGVRSGFLSDNPSVKGFANIARFFEHKGFSTFKDDQERIKRIDEIEKIIYIRIYINARNFDEKISTTQITEKLKSGFLPYTNVLRCESPLRGKDVYYTDGN